MTATYPQKSALVQFGTGSSAIGFQAYTFPVSLSTMQPNGPLDLYIRKIGGLRANLSPVYFGPDGLEEVPLYFSEGAYGLHLGKLCLPYVNTTQAALVSLDHSGFRAANKRVHSINSELNAMGLRWYAGIGTKFIRDTSTSNPALAVGDTLTDNITAISHLCFDHTRYLAVATDGTTDDIKGTTDPTASPPTWATLIPLTSGDYVSGMALLPTLSGGINVFYGKINGVTAISFTRCADALLTLPSPIDISTGSVDPTVHVDASYANCGTAADDSDVGTVAWTNASNATSLNGSLATVTLNNQTSHYLKCTNYGFSVPTAAVIVGVEVQIYISGNNNTSNLVYNQIRLVDDTDTFFGSNQAAAEPTAGGNGAGSAGILFSQFFGDSGDTWGAALTPAIVNDADFGVGFALRETASTSRTASVDFVTMTVYFKQGTDYVSVTKSPTKALQIAGTEGSSSIANVAWDTPSNVLSSNNTDARATWSATVDQNTNQLVAYDFKLGIPETALIRGIEVKIERAESNAASNASDETVQLMKSLTAVGDDKARTPEWETTDTTFAYGAPDDIWGTTWTPAEINSPGFGVVLEVEFDANDVDVDHIQVTVYYQVPETVITLEAGGTMQADPFDATRLWILAPESAQTTAITNPRHLYVLDLQWNETDDLPVGTLSKPYTGLPYVSHLTPFQGGAILVGGSNSTLFNQVRYISSDFQVRDLDFPPVHGANALTITAVHAQGEFAIVDTSYTDGSEAQRFLYYDGDWYPEWVQQDKAATTISTEPLLWAESELSLQQNYAYRFFPVSTTALAAAREFVPPNLYADPLLVSASIVKHDGPLYTQLAELFPASPEYDYTLMALQSQSRYVDDKTTWGTLQVKVDTGGDRTVASAEVDKTFPTTTATFADSNIVTSTDPGVQYRSLIIRLILDHTASSTKTPDALPIALFSAAQGRALERFGVALDFKNQNEDVVSLFNRLKALKATKAVQRFYTSGYDCPAVVEDVEFEYWPTLGSTPPRWEDVKTAVVVFQRVVGATS